MQQGGSVTTHTYGTASPNTPQGGTITAGTYTLTDVSLYEPGKEPATGVVDNPSTFVLTANTLETLTDKGGGNIVRTSATWATGGTTLNTTYTCKSPASNGTQGHDPYTATPTTLTLFLVAPEFSFEFTYTKK